MIEQFIGVVAPHRCTVCDKEGALLCDWCLPDAFPALPSRCFHCYAKTNEHETCKACKKMSMPKHVWAATEYADTAKLLIQKYKFERAKQAYKIIARELNKTLPHLGSAITITHIPTATARRRHRGYDQSELIAKELAKLRGHPHKTLLFRSGQTRQVGADKALRKRQMEQAFFVNNKGQPENVKILLVDDLITTGATVVAATKTLKKAGFKHIYAAAFAQKST